MTNLVGGAVRVLGTNLLAERSNAKLVDGTIRIGTAHGFTERVVTEEVVGTLLVIHARDWLFAAANHGIGIGTERGFAGAKRSLLNDLAFRIGSTCGSVARIAALVGDTGQRRGTIALLTTTNQTHLVQTDVTQETIVIDTASH